MDRAWKGLTTLEEAAKLEATKAPARLTAPRAREREELDQTDPQRKPGKQRQGASAGGATAVVDVDAGKNESRRREAKRAEHEGEDRQARQQRKRSDPNSRGLGV